MVYIKYFVIINNIITIISNIILDFFGNMTKIVRPTHTYLFRDKNYLKNGKGIDKFIKFNRKTLETKSLFMLNIIKPVENLKTLILIKNGLINSILVTDILPIIYHFFIRINLPVGILYENTIINYRKNVQLCNLQDCFKLPEAIYKIDETQQIDEDTKAKYTHIIIYYNYLNHLNKRGKIVESYSQRSFFLYYK